MKRKLKFSPQSNKVSVSDVLLQITTSLPTILAGQEPLAKITRAKYLALVKAGFSESEALKIVSN